MSAANPTPEEIQAAYGFVGALARAIPELSAILQQAVREQWTGDRFSMTVADSAWWKANHDAARQWITLQVTDPATAGARHNIEASNVLTFAQQLGIAITWEQAREAALWKMLSPGGSDERFEAHLYAQYWRPGQPLTGRAAEVHAELDGLRHAYGMSDAQLGTWLQDNLGRVLRHEDTIEGARRRAMDYAKSAYSQWAERIEAGETIADIARPGRDALSRLLEQDVEMNDVLMQQYLHARGDDGKPVDMPVWRLEQLARKDTRWQYTTNAEAAVGDMLRTIGKDWGYLK